MWQSAKDKLAANPASGPGLRDDMPSQPEGRVRYLEVEEWKAVFRACYIQPDKYGKQQEQWLQQAAGLALATGTRRGELLKVRIPDIRPRAWSNHPPAHKKWQRKTRPHQPTCSDGARRDVHRRADEEP